MKTEKLKQNQVSKNKILGRLKISELSVFGTREQYCGLPRLLIYRYILEENKEDFGKLGSFN